MGRECGTLAKAFLGLAADALRGGVGRDELRGLASSGVSWLISASYSASVISGASST